ncbi:MAG: PilZ domain-containing protein, partial [Acidobacteria bacterium]|nr:PilZ domain-containing protein [Acidobacteriota bacterium]
MSTAKAKRRKHVASPAATAVGAERRVAPRIPILAQIEAQGARQFVLGRASNISVGSLLVETRETLPEGTTVIVRFFVPPARQPVEAAGRVVREEPGRAMAISFLGLPERHRQKISDYVKASGVPAPVLEFKASERRRTGRIPRRLPVILSWQGEEGYQKQQAGETQDLSQHGARVLLYSPLEPGQLVRVTLPQTGTEAEARVVWARDSE